jgi:hypothetical protein
VGSHIIPKTRGLIVSGYSRVSIHFSLQENQANFTHNGVLTFAFKDDGTITNAAVQGNVSDFVNCHLMLHQYVLRD